MMDLEPLLLSRIQFAFLVTFHIIFPAFTIGLAAWLATLEAVFARTGNAIYRRVFDFWLRIFAVSFGMGVVSGIIMAFQFGTNWSVLSDVTGAIQADLRIPADHGAPEQAAPRDRPDASQPQAGSAHPRPAWPDAGALHGPPRRPDP